MEKISKAQVKLIKSLQLKKYRDELGLFVAEGEKCVEELRKAFELVLLVRDTENASRTEIEQMSSLHTPQGVIAVFRQQPAVCIQRSALVLVLDGIQDPGNLGTIIRTCDWFGVHDIVCSHDTADCYNPKVVQATMGALARVRMKSRTGNQKHPSTAHSLTAKICTMSSRKHPRRTLTKYSRNKAILTT